MQKRLKPSHPQSRCAMLKGILALAVAQGDVENRVLRLVRTSTAVVGWDNL
jgi:hypothetical protein